MNKYQTTADQGNKLLELNPKLKQLLPQIYESAEARQEFKKELLKKLLFTNYSYCETSGVFFHRVSRAKLDYLSELRPIYNLVYESLTSWEAEYKRYTLPKPTKDEFLGFIKTIRLDVNHYVSNRHKLNGLSYVNSSADL